MRLRDATPADISVIADLIRALADYERLTHEIEWTEDGLAATLFGPEAVPRVVLAEPTDPPGPAVGLAVWFPTYSTFLGRPGIWLEDLFVRPGHRGAGIGTALLHHLFERAGRGRVEWAVLDWNEPSLAFYRRHGAQPVPGWIRYRWTGGGPGR
jgi:GNAT superfamily N-acetyltransferase